MADKYILVIEDDEMQALLLVDLLEEKGYRVDTFCDWGAVDRGGREIFADLIILDIMLPGQDGFEVCRALRADARTKGIPIIMLTARADKDAQARGFDCGANGFLVKPCSNDSLMQMISELLEGSPGKM